MSRSRDPIVREFESAVAGEPIDLAATALTIAKLEYPQLDPAPHLAALDRLGDLARLRIGRVSATAHRARIAALNALLFEDEGFAGNHSHYDDFRNSLLNTVLDRRLGIPITLALVYMEVAGRAGIDVQGISFPGHFLMRVNAGDRARARKARETTPPRRVRAAGTPRSGDHGVPASERVGGSAGAKPNGLILDPFDAGVELDTSDCRKLLARHLGSTPDEAPFSPALLQPCSRRQMIGRMLNNLKRTYLEVRSFHHARRVTDLLLALEPINVAELRDRALLAYHLGDLPPALRDLEDYLRLRTWKDDDDREERQQLLDHVRTLKRRVASLN